MTTIDQKTQNCLNINRQLQSLIQIGGALSTSPFESERRDMKEPIALYRKEFNDNNCTQILEQYRQAELGGVIEKFSNLDKVRITSESVYERNQRVFFGGLALVAGVLIITMFSKKK
jgi:hypothetical protein